MKKTIAEYEPSNKEYEIMTVFDDFAQELHKIDTNTLNLMCKMATISIKHRLNNKYSEIDKLIDIFHKESKHALMEIVNDFEILFGKKDDSTAGILFIYMIREVITRMNDVGLDSSEIAKIAKKSAKLLQ